jgi:gliding motility-associated-like protein/uncharacterized repeat protein (TIGR01451 family)
MKGLLKTLLFTGLCILFHQQAHAQGNKLNITYSLPGQLTVCGPSDTFPVTVANISGSTVTGITLTVTLPPGINYVSGTVTGGGVSESNVSNLNAPVFAVPNIAVASFIKFTYRAAASCPVISFINGGGNVVNSMVANYNGNYDNKTTTAYNIRVPSLSMNISNQSFSGVVGTVFTRSITITNSGQGSLSAVNFRQVNKAGLQLIAVKNGTTTITGDTAWTALSGTHFAAVGNNNSFLDYNESIVIVDTLMILACSNFSSSYLLTWGCGNQTCQSATATGSVTISNKLPNLVVTPTASLNTCYGSSNASGQSMRIINNGTGPAKDVVLDIYQDGNMYSRIDVSSFQIKTGNNGTYTTFTPVSTTNASTSGSYSCLGSGPKGGAKFNLSLIGPGDTIFVRWNVYTCCISFCQNSGYVNRWIYSATYFDQCKNTTYYVPAAYGYGGYYKAMNVTPVIPTDMLSGEVKIFRYTIDSYALLAYDNDSSDLVLSMTFAPGLQLNNLVIYHANGITTWNLSSQVTVGNNIKAFFKVPIPFNLTQAEIRLTIKADCSVAGAGGFSNIGIQLSQRPDLSCTDTCLVPLSCFTSTVKVHCINTCIKGGMVFKKFTAERTSFGLPDNNDNGLPDASGSLDFSKIRRDKVMYGDTLETVFTGIAKITGQNPNWKHGYASSVITNGGNMLQVAKATVWIYRPGTGVTYICNNVASSYTTSGTTRTFDFDFSIPTIGSSGGCVGTNFRISSNDSVRLIIKYVVAGNLGNAVVECVLTNEFFLSNVANPTLAGNIYQCDTFSGNFIMAGYYFVNYGYDSYNFSSCGNITIYQSYYLSIGNCCSNYAGGNFFPYEYRSWAHLTTIKFVKPPGLTFVDASFNQVRTAGTLNGVTQSIYNIGSTTSGDTMVFNVAQYYKANGGTLEFSDDGFHGTFYATLTPTCALVSSTAYTANYSFDFGELNFLGNSIVSYAGGYDHLTFSAPNLVLNATLNPVDGLSDTAYWELSITNTTNNSNASNVWLAAPQLTGTKLVYVQDVATGTVYTPVNGIYKLGIINAQAMKKYRIGATYSSCNADSLIINAGWNCVYPADLTSYSCQKKTFALHVEPKNTDVQLQLADSSGTVSLCATIPFSARMVNVQYSSAFNVKLQVTLPTGTSFVTGVSKLTYPLSASPRTLPEPTLVSGNTYQWNISNFDFTIGQQGLKGVGDTSRNKLLVQYRIKTDCNYSSGSYSRVRPVAQIKCGDPVNSFATASQPIRIAGVVEPYYTIVTTAYDTIRPCSTPSKVRVKILNVGLDTTGNEDHLLVLLPPGLVYVDGSFNAVANAPQTSAPVVTNLNGQSQLDWKLTSGFGIGDSMVFEYYIKAVSSSLTCNTADIQTQSVVKQSIMCVSDSSNCLINVITGYDFQQVPVKRGNISFTQFSGSATPLGNSKEQVNLSLSFKNTGGVVDTNHAVYLRYYYDKDSNNVLSSNDVLLETDTIAGGFAAGATFSKSKSLTLAAGSGCGIIAAIDTGTCICNAAQVYFNNIPLKNAGTDKTVCSGAKTILGDSAAAGVYTYSWSPTTGLNNAASPNPELVIQNTGASPANYTYYLTSRIGNYCSKTDTVVVTVGPKINVNAGSDGAVCPGDSFMVGQSASGGTGTLSYAWSPGSVTNSTILKPYAKPGVNTSYSLLVTDTKGCTGTDTVVVNAYTRPTATFTTSNVCFGDSTIFTESSTVANGTLVKWEWNFGNGSSDTSTQKNPRIKYSGQGNYNVRLIVSSDISCKDTMVKSVSVYPLPVVGFSSVNTCKNDSAYFSDTSSLASGSVTGWSWDLGNSTTSSKKNPASYYTSEGSYTIRLTATTDKGCIDSGSRSITVYPRPVAQYSLANICAADSARFTDASSISSGSITSRFWTFGDNTSSAAKDPAHYYGTAGTYNVKLRVTSAFSCSDSISRSLSVFPLPAVSFNHTDVCLGDSNVFTDQSNISAGSLSSWKWSFGDGNTSAQRNPKHKYSTPGTYQVKLVVTSSNSCRDSVIKNVVVHPNPVSSFTFNTHCRGDSAYLMNGSSISSGSITGYFWTFGDGDTSTKENAGHLYDSSGTYGVKLKVTSAAGCWDTATFFVTVFPRPITSFTAKNICLDDNTIFTAQTTLSSGFILSRKWYFGDGDSSTSVQPLHNYATAATYNPRLIVTTDMGCRDSFTTAVTIHTLPVPGFTAANACRGDSVFFHDTTTASGGIASMKWFFGDGQNSAAQDPAHLYSASGIYSVKLVALSIPGCKDSLLRNITVYPKPVAVFNPLNECLKDSTLFSDLSTISSGTINNRTWDFGDGATSSQSSLKHLFAADGTYNVSLSVTSDFNCRDTVIKTVYVHPLPVAAFTFANTCHKDSVTFTNVSIVNSGTIMSRSWDFGDGGTSSAKSPRHSYAAPGTYQVKLKVWTNNGCIDSIIKSVQVNPLPVPAFKLADVCMADSAAFTDSSIIASGVVNSWKWYFGDGSVSTLSDPVHLYGSAGTFQVKMVVRSAAMCSDSITKSLVIFPQPVSAFSTSAICKNDSLVFTDISSVATGSVVSRQWDLGDGGSSSATSFKHHYADTGLYNTSLLVTTDKGCRDTLLNPTRVYPLPKAIFSSNNVCAYDTAYFNNQSQLNYSTSANWNWDFNDGSFSTQQNPKHVFAVPGNYPVKLVVTTAQGCMDSTSHTFAIYFKPTALFSSSDVCFGDTMHFADTSIGAITIRKWDLGDGTISSAVNVSHKYLTPGSYQAKLKIVTNLNCMDSIIKTVKASFIPVADFTPALTCFSDTAVFTDKSTVSASSISAWDWKFGDGSSSVQSQPGHRYADTGNYQVSLKVKSAAGCSDSVSRMVRIHPLPAASFAISDGCGYDTAHFTDQSSISRGFIANYHWDFGDGSTSGTLSPQHLYAVSGSYNILLTLTSDAGCIDTAIRNLNLFPKPQAAFPVIKICLGDSGRFTDQSSISSGSIVSWSWDFKDGFTSGAQHPVHMFANAGSYQVSLFVSSNTGCTDTVEQTILVTPYPSPAFSVNNTCKDDSVVITNTTTIASGTVTSWTWSLGDNSSSAQISPRHLYGAPGNYTIKLVAGSSFGCRDSVTHNVTIHPEPVAGFNFVNSCFGDSSSFFDASTVSSGSIVSRSWDFGDAGQSQALNPVHFYLSPANYPVKLKITTGFACVDSLVKYFSVFPKPIATIGTQDNCLSDSSVFNDLSFVSSGSIQSSLWDLNDGGTSGLRNPVHKYSAPGIYQVTLVTGTDKQCTDTLVYSVTVHPMPVAGFTASNVCVYDSVFFNDNSTIISGSVGQWQWDFGDGNGSSQQNPVHRYALPGSYNVRLISGSGFLCQDTIILPLTIYPKPTTGFTFNNPCLNDTAFFKDASNIITGSITGRSWNLGDGSTSSQSEPERLYAAFGRYDVRLITTSDNACNDTLQKTVTVHPLPVAVAITGNNCNGDSSYFADSSTVISGSIATRSWDFGNGKTSVQQFPAHLYDTAGVYTTSLLVTTGFSCRDSVSQQLTIYPKPSAGISLMNVCYGDSARFFDNSSLSGGSIITWYWDLGDGTISVQKNPVHLYAAAGTYRVSLQIFTDYGCHDTVSMQITVYPKPDAGFRMPVTCFGDPSSFTDISTVSPGYIINRVWDFGDTSSLSVIPSHTYNSPGFYPVKLYVYTDHGCRDTAAYTFTVHTIPVADFTAAGVCRNMTAGFTDLSTAGFDTISTWSWDFGDGNTSALQNPEHIYPVAGTYQVKLEVTSKAGCKAVTSQSIIVYPNPSASFYTVPVCLGDTSIFTNMSSIVSGSIVSSGWDFGDGAGSMMQDPQHIYSSFGSFQVRLVVTSAFGCTDTVIKTSSIYPVPVVNMNVAPSSGCAPLDLQFTDLTTLDSGIITNWFWEFGDSNISYMKDPQHIYYTPGIYAARLTVFTDKGCMAQSTMSAMINVFQPPLADFIINPDSVSILTPLISFTDTSNDALSWQWDFGDGNGSIIKNPQHAYTDTGWFNVKLMVTDDEGCSAEKSGQVFIAPAFTLFIPNAFSPNNNKINDVFEVRGIFQGIKAYNIKIWNRWGMLVYESDDISRSWDGSRFGNGDKLTDGVFIYSIEVVDYFGKRYNYDGDIHLLK